MGENSLVVRVCSALDHGDSLFVTFISYNLPKISLIVSAVFKTFYILCLCVFTCMYVYHMHACLHVSCISIKLLKNNQFEPDGVLCRAIYSEDRDYMSTGIQSESGQQKSLPVPPPHRKG